MKWKFNKIPDDEIQKKAIEAELPLKTVEEYHSELYALVLLLKTGIKNKKAEQTLYAWNTLKGAIESSMKDDSTVIFDVFAEAWLKMELKQGFATHWEASINDVVQDTEPSFVWEPRKKAPITYDIITMIWYYQEQHDRPPTRAEILDMMAQGEFPIDDSELCRQLKKLGWQKLIPTESDLAS
jgi:hypothetical protein